jgi:hypothetical protein
MAFTQTLTAGQISRAWKVLVDERLAPAGPVAVTKPDLVAAVNAMQDFLWTNRAAINSALPVAVRTALNTDQKMALLATVVLANLEG